MSPNRGSETCTWLLRAVQVGDQVARVGDGDAEAGVADRDAVGDDVGIAAIGRLQLHGVVLDHQVVVTSEDTEGAVGEDVAFLVDRDLLGGVLDFVVLIALEVGLTFVVAVAGARADVVAGFEDPEQVAVVLLVAQGVRIGLDRGSGPVLTLVGDVDEVAELVSERAVAVADVQLRSGIDLVPFAGGEGHGPVDGVDFAVHGLVEHGGVHLHADLLADAPVPAVAGGAGVVGVATAASDGEKEAGQEGHQGPAVGLDAGHDALLVVDWPNAGCIRPDMPRQYLL